MDFDFNTLVNNAYSILNNQTHNGNLILPEVVVEIGTTRIHWKNVKEYLKVIQRNPDHFMSWLKSELPGKEINWYSGSKSEGLIIHGKRQTKKDISHILMKYIKKYVTCSSCKNSNSTLTKENSIEKL